MRRGGSCPGNPSISAASRESVDIVPEDFFGIVEHSSNLTTQGGKPLANTTDTLLSPPLDDGYFPTLSRLPALNGQIPCQPQ